VTNFRQRERSTDTDQDWQAVVFDRSLPENARAMDELLRSGRVYQVCDTIVSQLEDLARSRLVRRSVPQSDIEAWIKQSLGGVECKDFGRWIYYPWSGYLVHLLAPNDFRHLRLDRNRHKITPPEQERLSTFVVGIVGLSTGNVIARTLCLEGTSEQFKLADFDSLDLSNLNRIEGGLHELGLPKTTLAARRLAELNPYATIVVFEHGLTGDNVDEFLEGEPKVGAVIDECDNLRIKLLLRERSRSRGIPVLMATSDRGMLDIERFDLEPARPIFHGLLPDISAESIGTLTDEQKLTLVLAIVGSGSMSTRAAASMLEMKQTISTWPQLASDVVLGGATMTAAVRRLALDQPLPSGRHYIDLDEILAARTSMPASVAGDAGSVALTAGATASKVEPDTVLDSRLPSLIQFIVKHAVLVPSGGNCQPWRFYFDGSMLWLVHDRKRSKNLLDFEHRGAYIAFGAVLENIRIAAAERGYTTSIEPFPCPQNDAVIARLTFASGQRSDLAREADLFPLLQHRVTNRRRGLPEQLPEWQLAALMQVAESSNAHIHFLTQRTALSSLGRIIGACDRIRFLCRPLHEELVAEIRWTPDDARRTRNGLDLETLELTSAQAAVLQLLARPTVASLLHDLHAGHGLEELSAGAIENSSAVGLLWTNGRTPVDILNGGSALERLWLLATRFDLGLQPFGAMIAMFAMLDTSSGQIFSTAETSELVSRRTQFQQLIPVNADRTDLLLFRLSKVPPPTARSVRLPLSQVLFYGEPRREA
jgi:molybdopterin/thiamine biosynthesis adenylyltransferase